MLVAPEEKKEKKRYERECLFVCRYDVVVLLGRDSCVDVEGRCIELATTTLMKTQLLLAATGWQGKQQTHFYTYYSRQTD